MSREGFAAITATGGLVLATLGTILAWPVPPAAPMPGAVYVRPPGTTGSAFALPLGGMSVGHWVLLLALPLPASLLGPRGRTMHTLRLAGLVGAACIVALSVRIGLASSPGPVVAAGGGLLQVAAWVVIASREGKWI